MAASHHGDTPHSGNSVTSVPVTPYTTSVDVNPESGEEAFMIEHHDDDSVGFRVTAFSRPATRLAKIAGPLGAVVQRQITARYLRSLANIAVQ